MTIHMTHQQARDMMFENEGVVRNLDIAITSKDGERTLYIDTLNPGTALNSRNHRDWLEKGWGHYTLARNDKRWGEQGKVVNNGAFMPLSELDDVVAGFLMTHDELMDLVAAAERAAGWDPNP